MTLIQEWHSIFESTESIYLFGAGEVAKLLIKRALNDKLANKISGILVSDLCKLSVSELEQIPIFQADQITDKNITIMIATSEKYKNEIYSYLHKLGFVNIIDGFKFIHVMDEDIVLNDDVKKEIEALRSKEMTVDTLKQIIKLIYGEKQLFSRNNKFYQSLPLLGFEGVRQTDTRIETYALQEIVAEKKVLDIGCNVAFLDISISKWAKTIKGIEYSKSLVDVANEVVNYLQLQNIEVVQGDFLSCHLEEKYDVILLFAVHGWLGCSPEKGTDMLINILGDSGIIVFESQNWDKGDLLYNEYSHFFKEKGLKLVREGMICDDGETRRKWSVYQK